MGIIDLFTIVPQKSFVPRPSVQGWDKTFLDIYIYLLLDTYSKRECGAAISIADLSSK